MILKKINFKKSCSSWTKFIYCSFLIVSFSTPTASSQNIAFDSLANEVNRLAIYKKTKSLELLDSLYKMAHNSPDSSLLIAHCLYEEIMLSLNQGINNPELIDRIKQRLNKENLSHKEHALLQTAFAINLVMKGEYSDAFTLLLQSNEIFKQLDLDRLQARTLTYLGNISYNIGLYNLSDYYYSEAILNANPEFHEYYIIKHNILKNELFVNKNEIALDSMLFLLENVKKNGHEELIPLIYLNLGGYFSLIDIERGFSYLTVFEFLDSDNSQYEGNFNNNMGNYFLEKNNLTLAHNYFKESEKIFEENSILSSLPHVYNNLSTLFEKKNMPDSALFYARKLTEILKILHSNTVAIENHQKYITSIVEEQKKDLIITNQKVELRNRLIIIIAILLFSVILLFILFYQLKRRKTSELTSEIKMQKLEQEKQEEILVAKVKEANAEIKLQKMEKEKQDVILEAKIREITSYSLLVSSKNHILMQVKGINAHIIDGKENPITTAKKIDKIINDNLNTDNEWDNFKMHFEKVHPHFFEKLKKQCNTLTEENMKLCAYFKIGLSNKQIAQLLNVLPRTVIYNRCALKKKLDLPDEQKLNDFIDKL
jgi:tetratricopeptide (TPR) repeat protein